MDNQIYYCSSCMITVISNEGNPTKNTDLFGNELIVVNDICMHVKRVINR